MKAATPIDACDMGIYERNYISLSIHISPVNVFVFFVVLPFISSITLYISCDPFFTIRSSYWIPLLVYTAVSRGEHRLGA